MIALITALQHLLGPEHVLTSDSPGADLSAWEQDWRQRARGKALAVLRPGNTAEVAGVVQLCAAQGTAIVPQGGNTGLVVGSIPDHSGTQVVLSLTRMNQVRELDTHNQTLTAEAGCTLAHLQEVAAQAGWLFPLSLASEGSCTMGGNLATNAGGTQVLRYGNARDLCLGLEVVTAQGQIWHGLSGLRKDNTGYDLRHLMIGSEGTLGIITAATFKLFPPPAARLTAWAAVPDLSAAVRLLGMAQRQLGAGLTGFEVMSQFSLSLVAKHLPQLQIPLYEKSPWGVLLELSDGESEAHALQQLEALLEAALLGELIRDAVVAQNLTQAQALWQVRESISMAQAKEGLNIKHDISLPISRIPDFVAETDTLLQNRFPGVRLVNFGHLGDGNLHYNVQAPLGVDSQNFLHQRESEINTLVFNQVQKYKGSISAEHGIGLLKAQVLPNYKDPTAVYMMRAIKQALDPLNIFNPGKVIIETSAWKPKHPSP